MIVKLEILESDIPKETMKDLKRLMRVWKMKSIEDVIAFLVEPGMVSEVERKIKIHKETILASKSKWKPISVSRLKRLSKRMKKSDVDET